MMNALVLAVALFAAAAPETGKPAPDFTLPGQDGKPVKLSTLKGSWVVLEWFNKDCPFVRKHYGSKNMQGLQKRYAAKGVKWYSIISSKPGKQGHLTAKEAEGVLKDHEMGSTAILLDPKGTVGRLYQAKTTPHMFVIDPKGTLVFMGGIDDKPTADAEDVPGARNHVAAALDEAMAGKKVSVPTTRPYGCSVKY
ncbi:MAG: thioredoxin family protein [Elusimicrobiota bacterium]|nr:thioredoxin family protein [Elusimicrobiota bacterium]